MKTLSYKISGMSCAACSARIEKALRRTKGIKSANVNLATNSMLVEFEEEVIDSNQIIKVVEDTGYKAFLHADLSSDQKRAIEKKEYNNLLIRFVVSAVFSLPLFSVMFIHMSGAGHFLNQPIYLYIQLVFATIVQFGTGWTFYTGAYKAIKYKSLNMDVLVALGTTAAYALSIYNMAVFLMAITAMWICILNHHQ
jgi:Cu+-exporting ATPase